MSRRTETIQASGIARAVKAQPGFWCGRGLDSVRATGTFAGVCRDRAGKQRRLEGKHGWREASREDASGLSALRGKTADKASRSASITSSRAALMIWLGLLPSRFRGRAGL